MRLRKRDLTPDANGVPSLDMRFGRSAADYWQDVPDAPAQLVTERLNLWTGDWFLDLSEGMPWRTAVLGKFTESARDRAIRARILGTQGVVAIDGYAAQLNRDTRAMGAQVSLRTAYGTYVPQVGSTTADVRAAR